MRKSWTFVFMLGAACGFLMATQSFAASKARPVILLVHIPLKQGDFSDFLTVMHANVKGSRQETGNGSFNVFQPEDGSPDLYLVENWKSQPALDIHNGTQHLNAVKTAFQTAGRSGEPMAIDRLTEISPKAPDKPDVSPETTRNVIVVIHAKPETRQKIKKVLLGVVKPSRGAPGNLVFDVYQEQANQNAFVLVERWVNVAAHEAHLAQPYNRPMKDLFATALSQPLETDRHLLKDVAQ